MCRSHGRWLELLHAGPQNTGATKVSYRAHAHKLFSVDIHELQPHACSVAGYKVPYANRGGRDVDRVVVARSRIWAHGYDGSAGDRVHDLQTRDERGDGSCQVQCENAGRLRGG